MLDKNKKILTSNFTLKEQNYYFKKQILNPEKKEISFLNKQLSGITNGVISFLEEDNQITCQKEIMPNIIIEATFLKDIFLLLLNNSLNRNFIITILNDEEIIINDLLTNEIKKIKVKIYLKNKTEFSLNSIIFYKLKLNLKTITNKSIIYIWDNQIVYENNRKKLSFYYLFKI